MNEYLKNMEKWIEEQQKQWDKKTKMSLKTKIFIVILVLWLCVVCYVVVLGIAKILMKIFPELRE